VLRTLSEGHCSQGTLTSLASCCCGEYLSEALPLERNPTQQAMHIPSLPKSAVAEICQLVKHLHRKLSAGLGTGQAVRGARWPACTVRCSGYQASVRNTQGRDLLWSYSKDINQPGRWTTPPKDGKWSHQGSEVTTGKLRQKPADTYYPCRNLD
jgi:hypothetical protein